MNEITKGTIVSYHNGEYLGFYRVSACFKNTVNLGGIFGPNAVVKQVPKSKVKEACVEWSEKWAQSETYQSM